MELHAKNDEYLHFSIKGYWYENKKQGKASLRKPLMSRSSAVLTNFERLNLNLSGSFWRHIGFPGDLLLTAPISMWKCPCEMKHDMKHAL